MSYYYEDPEYADYGNHSDKYDEYESYSDYTEPDHYEHEDAPGEFEHGHGEPEYEAQELEELDHHNDGTGEDWEIRDEREIEGDEEIAHELGELEHEYEGGIHEPFRLGYEGYEHEELVHEPKRDTETNYTEHDTETDYAEHEPIGFDRNVEQTGEYVPPIPFPSPPSPTSTPYAREAPRSNQRSHVTASEYRAYAFNNNDGYEPRGFECDGVSEHEGPVYLNTRTADGAFPRPQLIYHEESGEYVHPDFLTPAQIAHHHKNPNPPPLSSTQNQPAPSPRNYTDINILLQDIRDGDSEAIAYMAELNRYTEECGRIEMEKQINGDDEYGEKDSGREPQQTNETKDPKNNTMPTGPPLANTPISPPPPSSTTLGNDTPTHTTPYLTSRSRPQPWPNKKHNKHHFGAHTPAGTTTRRRPQPWPNKRRNKHHYGIRTPAGTTAKRRPPPWPILPTPTPILSIGGPHPPPWPNIRHCHRKKYSPVSTTSPTRPPPWPILSHHIHSTSQNRRNAKRRIRAQSRSISDEVSF
jgi:hypothetical protein